MSNYFANRENESKSFLDYITQRKHIDIYGPTGIGKTRFIQNTSSIKEIFPIVVISVDDIHDFKSLLEKIAEKVDDFFRCQIFLRFKEYIRKNNGYQTEVAESRFRSCVKDALKENEFFLCFDHTEKCKHDIWIEFQEKILLRFLKCHDGSFRNLGIITAGQKQFSWSFKLRYIQDCSVPFPIKLFTQEKGTSEMVEILARKNNIKVDHPDLAIEFVHQLTLGHPECIRIVVEKWTRSYEYNLDGKEITPHKYKEGLQALRERFVEERIIVQLSGLKKGKDYPPSETIFSLLQCLVLLRSISSKVLRATLRRISPDFYQKKATPFFDDLFLILEKSHFIEKDNKINNIYKPSRITRYILLEDLQKNHPDKLFTLHQKITEGYEDLVEQSNGNSQSDFIEILYHAICQEHTTPEIQANLERYFKKYDADMKSLEKKIDVDPELSDRLSWKKIFKSLGR